MRMRLLTRSRWTSLAFYPGLCRWLSVLVLVPCAENEQVRVNGRDGYSTGMVNLLRSGILCGGSPPL
ncbi:hypothetical protein ACVXHB_31105 [Escherichia coli]